MQEKKIQMRKQMQEQTGTSEGSRERILDAVEASLQTSGVGRLTVSQVSRQAGLSRQAIYSYFPTKDELISAFLIRSGERLARHVERVFEQLEDAHEALHLAILQTLTFVQTSPIFQETSERDELAPFLSSRGELLIGLGREMMATLLARYFAITERAARLPADSVVRLFISHILTPDPDASREDVARQLTDFLLKVVSPPKAD